MKMVNTSAKLLAALLMLAFTSKAQNSKYDDDVYYSPSKAQSEKASEPAKTTTGTTNANDYSAPQQDASGSDNRFDYSNSDKREPSSTTTEQRDGNTYVTNNYYEEDDYYDYYYTSRIRRFHRPLWGYGYYDPFYTNSYWYDYNPYNWGTSIYLGYNWWAPSSWYSPYYCSYGLGYSPWNGWGFSLGWGYNPWNNWGWYNGYNHGYANGYWNGYYDGLYNGYYNPYYFNSYDQLSYNNVYYGPRRTTGSSNKTVTTPRSVGQTYYQALNKDVKNTLPVSNTFASTYSIPRPMSNSALENSTPRSNNVEVKPGNVKGNDSYTSPGRPVKSNSAADGYTPRSNNADVKPSTSGSEAAPATPRNNTNPDPRPMNNVNSDPRPMNNVNSEPRPRNNAVTPTPRNNNYNSEPRPKNNYNSEPRPKNNSGYVTPKNNSEPRPRNNYENSTPRPSYSEPAKPRTETPKSFDTPRPRQERNVTTPTPSRPSNNNSAPRQNSNEQKRGGR